MRAAKHIVQTTQKQDSLCLSVSVSACATCAQWHHNVCASKIRMLHRLKKHLPPGPKLLDSVAASSSSPSPSATPASPAAAAQVSSWTSQLLPLLMVLPLCLLLLCLLLGLQRRTQLWVLKNVWLLWHLDSDEQVKTGRRENTKHLLFQTL